MILKTATPEEKGRQLRGVVNAFAAGDGLAMKYMKQLKDRKVPDGKILGVHRYTIKGCETYVVVVKRNYGRSRSISEMTILYYVKVINPSTGRVSYLRPNFDIEGMRSYGYLEFTEHFIARLRERDSKEFPDLLKTAGADTLYWKEGEDGNMESTFGGYRVFGKRDGDNVVVTTMVTDDMLHDNQRPTTDVIKVKVEEYNTIKNRIITAA